MEFSLLAIASFVCFQCLLCTVEAKTHTFSMTVGRIDGAPDGFYIPDGLFAINGWSPAPPIYVDTGDRVIATVTNSLKTGEGSLIHWHGLLQKGSNRMDGVPFITQSLVMPGENFTYDFYVDLPGTYWYHSHYAEQYIEGLRGAFIARYKPDLAIYDDVALVLSDWYHENKTYALEKYLVPSAEGVEPVPFTALINGVGQNESCITELSCKYVSVLANQFTSECGAYATYAELLAAQSASATAEGAAKATRLRLVDGSAFAVLNVSIDDHFFWVTALDGNPVEPQKAE
jgi:iron transport multicopper oxidase